jgi:hypothetical protein
MTYQIDILNPKANKLLKDLADMQLISITEMAPSNPLFNSRESDKKKSSPDDSPSIGRNNERIRSR